MNIRQFIYFYRKTRGKWKWISAYDWSLEYRRIDTILEH